MSSYIEFLASKAIRAQDRGLSAMPALSKHLFLFQREPSHSTGVDPAFDQWSR